MAVCDWCGMASCPHGARREPVKKRQVVCADDMDNETFLKHMDKGHAREVANGPLAGSLGVDDGWVGPYRAFHDRMHELHHETQDHEHLW